MDAIDEARMVVLKQWSENSNRYVVPFYYGPPPPFDQHNKILSNGSAFLMEGFDVSFGVTCAHCIKGLRDRQQVEENVILRIGDMYFPDFESRIIDFDQVLDLCTFEVKKNELTQIRRDARFLMWHPPLDLTEAKAVLVVGYPRHSFKVTGSSSLEMGSLSILEQIRNENLGSISFVIEFDTKEWEFAKNPSRINIGEMGHFGGLSGCPVFVQNGFDSMLAGIVYESFSDNGSMQYLMGRYNVIDMDGLLIRG